MLTSPGAGENPAGCSLSSGRHDERRESEGDYACMPEKAPW